MTMISIDSTDDTIVINVTYDDNSDPPVTHFLVHVGADLTYQRGPNEFPLVINSTLFMPGRAVPVVVEAVNLFGSLNFTDSFNIPQRECIWIYTHTALQLEAYKVICIEYSIVKLSIFA